MLMFLKAVWYRLIPLDVYDLSHCSLMTGKQCQQQAASWGTSDLALRNLEPLSASVSSSANQRKRPIMISKVFLVWKYVMRLNASLGATSIRESIQKVLNVVNSTESNCPYYILKRKMLRADWAALENMKQITNENNLTVRPGGTTSNYCHSKHSTSCWQNSAGKTVIHGPLVSGTVIQYGCLSQAQWSNGVACLKAQWSNGAACLRPAARSVHNFANLSPSSEKAPTPSFLSHSKVETRGFTTQHSDHQ